MIKYRIISPEGIDYFNKLGLDIQVQGVNIKSLEIVKNECTITLSEEPGNIFVDDSNVIWIFSSKEWLLYSKEILLWLQV